MSKIKVFSNYTIRNDSIPSAMNNAPMLGRAIMIFPRSTPEEKIFEACRNSPTGIVTTKKPVANTDWIATGQFGSIEGYGKALSYFIAKGLIPISTSYIPKLDELEGV